MHIRVLTMAICFIAGCGTDITTSVILCDSASNNPGTLQILNPEKIVSGQPGEIRLAYLVGEDGLIAGNTLRLELPTAWYNRSSCPKSEEKTRYQSTDSNKANYFGILAGGERNRFSYSTMIDQHLDARPNRFKSVLEIHLEEGTLEPGEQITLLIRGWKEDQDFMIPDAAGSGWIRGEVISGTTTKCSSKIDPVRLQVKSSTPVELIITVPSIAEKTELQTLKMHLIDEYYNPCPKWPAAITIQAPRQVKGLPIELSVEELNDYEDGLVTLIFSVTEPGCYQVKAQLGELGTAESNPVCVNAERYNEKLYWGDLHSHSEISMDGMGDGSFQYARDVSLLDFFSVTEHHAHDVKSTLLPASVWESIKQDVRDYYEPGAFVTLLAFENSAATPSGHQNIYYPTDEGPLLLGGQLDETWKAVRSYFAFIIQHHPGIIWYDSSLPVFMSQLYSLFIEGAWINWNAFADIPRPALEIYSLHGQSEYYNPLDSLSYENCDLTLPRDGLIKNCNTGLSMNGPHYARNAWASGLRMGVVAASDDHRAQPGKPGGGLTAVWAKSLTRENIFSSIENRSTYATTGDRIVLDFRINGSPMGSEITTADAPEITIHVAGTAAVEYLQVMRFQKRTNSWEVIHEARSQQAEFSLSLEDKTFLSDSIYYVRLEQVNKTHGRSVRAWSSPIWVQYSNK